MNSNQNNNVIRSMLLFALIGAVAATLCDANHAFTKTLSYPNPFLFQQAWWVSFGFVGAFFTMALSYYKGVGLLSLELTGRSTTHRSNILTFIESLILFVLVYLMSGFGNHYPAHLSIIFYSLFVIRLMATYEKQFLLIIALILGVSGIFVEGLMTQVDLVHYRQPEVFGVPFWLGGVYMHGAFALREGMRYFVYKN